MKRERLFAHIPARRVGAGISEQDIARVQVVPELVGQIIDCLESDDQTDVGFGLWFAEKLQLRPEFVAMVEPELSRLLPVIGDRISDESPQVRESAMGAFVAFRQYFPDYTTKMRELLRSSDPIVRSMALYAAPTFLSAKQLEVLLPFRDDPVFGETGGMGGPLRYYYRDSALEIAERIAGLKFNCGDCFEQRDGVRISWRSWSAFTNWLESRKGWWLFSK